MPQSGFAGSLWGTSWAFVIAILPWILVLVPYAMWKARSLNVLQLGDPLATGVGLRVERERGKLILPAPDWPGPVWLQAAALASSA